jgi:hypothetical protein
MSELKFPFKFAVSGNTYNVVMLGDGYPEVTNLRTGWSTTVYSEDDIISRIKEGIWKVVDETAEEQDPEVIIKQSDAFVRITQEEYDSLIDEINMLRELVAEITLETDYTALGQQASTYRALNEKMLKHHSYKKGDGGSTREGELLDQLDTLFAAYDSLAGKQKEQQFRPISEMTLEDWQQAMEEGWEFLDNYGYVNTVTKVTDEVFFSGYCFGFSVDGKHSAAPKSYFIKARIK